MIAANGSLSLSNSSAASVGALTANTLAVAGNVTMGALTATSISLTGTSGLGSITANGLQLTGATAPVEFAGTGGSGAVLNMDWSTYGVGYAGNNLPAWRWQMVDAGNFTGSLNLQQSTTTNTSTSRMYITTGGLTGFGTTTPAQIVDVVGNVRASGNLIGGGAYLTGNVTANTLVTGPAGLQVVQTSTNSPPTVGLYNTFNNNGNVVVGTAANSVAGGLYWLDDGNYSTNFSLGSRTPGNASNAIVSRLAVASNGNVTISGNVLYQQATIPSYVFGPSLAANQAGFVNFNNAPAAPGAANSVGIGVYGSSSGITVTANAVGINTAAPQYGCDINGNVRITSGLSFNSQTQNQIICMNSGDPNGNLVANSTNYLGFGINNSTLRYQVPVNQNHTWYAGTTPIANLNSSALTVAGGLFVPTANISGGLSMNNQVNNQVISLWTADSALSASSTNYYGFGLNASTLRYQVPAGQCHAWYASASQVANLSSSGLTIPGGIMQGTSTDSGRVFSGLNSGMSTNGYSLMCFGQASSTNNQGELGFNYMGSGSSQNRVCLGLYGQQVLSVLNNAVGIFQTAPAYTLDVSGSARVTNQVLHGMGTAAAPSVAFTNQLNTGLYQPVTNAVGFVINGSENMRLTSTGLGVGTLTPSTTFHVVGTAIFPGTSAASTIFGGSSAIPGNANAPAQFYGVANTRACISTYQSSNASQNHMEFFTSQQTGAIGYINTTGTSTSFGTASDRRLKRDIAPLKGASGLVRKLRPVEFGFKTEDPLQRYEGFIADEVGELVPRAVIGTKDRVDANGAPVYQALDAGKLVPWVVAALKETMAALDRTNAELADLKRQVRAASCP